jgi:hypothetical protein
VEWRICSIVTYILICGGSSEQQLITSLPQLGLQNVKHFDPIQIENFLDIYTSSLY